MGSLHSVETQYAKLLEREDRKQNQDLYTGKRGGVLFLRYIGRYRDHFYKALGETSYISSQEIRKKVSSNFKKNIKIPRIRYDILKQIWYRLLKVDDSYNTEDGQIRWMEANEFDINLGHFWALIPSEVRKKMNNWKKMDLPLQVAKDVRMKLHNIDKSYNTEDGQIRWLEDNDLEINLSNFWSVIPTEIRTKMNKWQRMNLPLKKAKYVRKKLFDIDNFYNTEDGQISWLEDNDLEINLGQLWSVIPEKVIKRMNKWKKMNLPLETAKDIRIKIRSIDKTYNTEDGQIRWMEDNEFEINLSNFWSVLPTEIRKKMNKWKKNKATS